MIRKYDDRNSRIDLMEYRAYINSRRDVTTEMRTAISRFKFRTINVRQSPRRPREATVRMDSSIVVIPSKTETWP